MSKERELFAIVDLGETTQIRAEGRPEELITAFASLIRESDVFRAIFMTAIDAVEEGMIDGLEVIKKEQGFKSNIKPKGYA
jgi:hypothetical protein